MNLGELVDKLGGAAYGMTRTQAHHDKVCIQCHKSIFNAEGQPDPEMFHSAAGLKEYELSAMCEKCFDGMFENDE